MVDHWTVQRLALLAGHGPARAMLLAAETMSGHDAVRLGFAQRAGSVDDALAWAHEIAKLAPEDPQLESANAGCSDELEGPVDVLQVLERHDQPDP